MTTVVEGRSVGPTDVAAKQAATVATGPRRFEIGEDQFLLDGEPFRVLSGAIHYFRVHPDQWADRIHKARLMGLNTVETYVAWNAHERRPGQFNLSGGLDLGHFIDLIAAEGMFAIVRPGPYICAEWDNGGLPAWLREVGVQHLRSSEPAYLAAVERYMQRVGAVLASRQIDRGGPLICVQVENEYGAYGSDHEYVRELAQIQRRAGITVPMVTVDQPNDVMLAGGGVPELLRTGSFGSRAEERFDTLRRHQSHGPLMSMEFWNGWFDAWGEHHHNTEVATTAADLEVLLKRGGSVNFYMFHGGTNFGFTNGANDQGRYLPVVTSYDYDAPIDERGNPTAKYWTFREVIARYAPVPDELPSRAGASPCFNVEIEHAASFWDVVEELASWKRWVGLPSADEIGSYDGFTLYRTQLPPPKGAAPASVEQGLLVIDEVRDRAQVFVDRVGVGTLERTLGERTLALPPGAQGVLELLVEDQGRVNYGPRLGEAKGLIGASMLDGVPLEAWEAMNVDLDRLEPIEARLAHAAPPRNGQLVGPVFASATFRLERVTDLHLSCEGWGKGIVWLNGFCLGRYWSRGPQRTLYVPAPLLRMGENELLLFELHGAATAAARFVAEPDLGHGA